MLHYHRANQNPQHVENNGNEILVDPLTKLLDMIKVGERQFLLFCVFQ